MQYVGEKRKIYRKFKFTNAQDGGEERMTQRNFVNIWYNNSWGDSGEADNAGGIHNRGKADNARKIHVAEHTGEA